LKYAHARLVPSALVLIVALGSHRSRAESEAHLAERVALAPVSDLVKMLDSRNRQQRAAASAALLRIGEGALPEMVQAGAKPVSTNSPKRIDMLYSLIKGLDPGMYQPDSLGITLDEKTDRNSIGKLAARHGFVAPDPDSINRQSQPNCHVTLQEGTKLESVLRSLMTDPAIRIVNLNYFDY